MASVEFKARALKELGELDSVIGKRIVEKIVWFEQNFDSIQSEKLHHDLRDFYKLRVGDYRVVYSIVGDVITIEKIRHRRDVYK